MRHPIPPRDNPLMLGYEDLSPPAYRDNLGQFSISLIIVVLMTMYIFSL